MNVPSTCAVLFVDVTGSRASTRISATSRACRIHHRLRRLERAAAVFGGRVVKHLGDGLMLRLHGRERRSARGGRDAAGGDAAEPRVGVGIHVGCHYGPVLDTAGDLYGDSVNVAARIAGLAKTGQIIVTREVVDRLDEVLRQSVRSLGHATVKGRREPVEILEYVWERESVEELTIIRQSVSGERASRLRLVCAGRERWFDGAGTSSITLGRDAASDVVVGDREASRRHARIEKRRDKFVLVDQSANGTYVAMADETERCLRREELILRARGRNRARPPHHRHERDGPGVPVRVVPAS